MTSPQDYEMLERLVGTFGQPQIQVYKGVFSVRMDLETGEGPTLADAVLQVRGKLLEKTKKAQAEEIERFTAKMAELDLRLDAIYGGEPESTREPSTPVPPGGLSTRSLKDSLARIERAQRRLDGAPDPTPPAPPQGTLVPAELLDQVYTERNLCVLLACRLAKALGWRTGIGKHNADDAEWDRDWLNIAFLDTPAGQLSWHLHDSEMRDTGALLPYGAPWDGHTTEEKYSRVRALLDPRTVVQALPHSLGGVFPQITHSAPVVTGISGSHGRITLDDPKDITKFERIPWEDKPEPTPPSQRILNDAPQLGGWRAAVAAFEAAGYQVDHGYKIGELKFSINKKNSPFFQVTIPSFEPKVVADAIVRLTARWDDEVRKVIEKAQHFRMTLE